MPKKKRMVECVGGPLCGHEMPSRPRVCFVDNDRIPHFYRRIKLLRKPHSYNRLTEDHNRWLLSHKHNSRLL